MSQNRPQRYYAKALGPMRLHLTELKCFSHIRPALGAEWLTGGKITLLERGRFISTNNTVRCHPRSIAWIPMILSSLHSAVVLGYFSLYAPVDRLVGLAGADFLHVALRLQQRDHRRLPQRNEADPTPCIWI
jgi:hypothetical protein